MARAVVLMLVLGQTKRVHAAPNIFDHEASEMSRVFVEYLPGLKRITVFILSSRNLPSAVVVPSEGCNLPLRQCLTASTWSKHVMFGMAIVMVLWIQARLLVQIGRYASLIPASKLPMKICKAST